MKRVSGYQTTDGKIFTQDQKQQARDHQAALNVVDGVQKVCDQFNTSAIYARDDIAPGYRAINTSFQLADFIMRNAELLKLAFAGKPVNLPDTDPVAEAPVNRDAEPVAA